MDYTCKEQHTFTITMNYLMLLQSPYMLRYKVLGIILQGSQIHKDDTSKLITQNRISQFFYQASFRILFCILAMSNSLFYLDGGIRRQFTSRLQHTTMNEQWPDLHVQYQSSMTPAIWLCAECTTLRKDLQLSTLHL